MESLSTKYLGSDYSVLVAARMARGKCAFTEQRYVRGLSSLCEFGRIVGGEQIEIERDTGGEVVQPLHGGLRQHFA